MIKKKYNNSGITSVGPWRFIRLITYELKI